MAGLVADPATPTCRPRPGPRLPALADAAAANSLARRSVGCRGQLAYPPAGRPPQPTRLPTRGSTAAANSPAHPRVGPRSQLAYPPAGRPPQPTRLPARRLAAAASSPAARGSAAARCDETAWSEVTGPFADPANPPRPGNRAPGIPRDRPIRVPHVRNQSGPSEPGQTCAGCPRRQPDPRHPAAAKQPPRISPARSAAAGRGPDPLSPTDSPTRPMIVRSAHSHVNPAFRLLATRQRDPLASPRPGTGGSLVRGDLDISRSR
ncbi:hypothetical protein SAMN04489727_2803 [Amycolatopsis tolypomycina]|uniref:Uncharacterized protein n=1 Tax=Amycolatopsis tolypomycina TaxID=208445 RepID=A0A1H4QAR3_9PSEU|nr:hypothetical protein SAMN04489727_2803 [Amycolatopsis tolypomycina]